MFVHFSVICTTLLAVKYVSYVVGKLNKNSSLNSYKYMCIRHASPKNACVCTYCVSKYAYTFYLCIFNNT